MVAPNTATVPPIELLNIQKLPPTGYQWLQVCSGIYLIALVLATIAVLAVLLLAAVHLICINKYISNKAIQSNLHYISLLLPIVGLCSLLAMYMPRCALLMLSVCMTYLMICLMMVVQLMENLFVTMQACSNYLIESKQRILFSVPPFCCCCKCCPTVSPTVDNLTYVKWMVMQSPYVRIVLEIILFIAFLEGNTSKTLIIIINALEVTSMLSATWGCQILTLLSKERLKAFCFGTIFQLINTTQVFFTLQKVIFDLIGQYHGFDDGEALSHVSKAMFWNNFMLCLEMLLLSVLATLLVNPKRSVIFDKHPFVRADYRQATAVPMRVSRRS